MSIEDKVENLEIVNKFLNSQLSALDERVRTLELSLIKNHISCEESDKKTRSKLDYLLKEIQKLREPSD